MPQFGYQLCSFGRFGKVLLFTGVPAFVVNMFVNSALTMTKQTGVLNMMNFSMVVVSYLVSIFRYS